MIWNLEGESSRKEKNLEADFFTFSVEEDPTSYEESMKYPDETFYREALNNEIESILSNNTWEKVDLCQGNKHF